jgi:hypothetical protein
MPRCKAPEILRNEAYLDVRRNDEGLGKRSRWAFFSSLLMYIFMVCKRSDLVDSEWILEIKLLKKGR